MPKVEPTKEERRFNAAQLASEALRHALTLKRDYTEDEVRESLELLKTHHPKLMKWLEGVLHEVNTA